MPRKEKTMSTAYKKMTSHGSIKYPGGNEEGAWY